MLLQQAIEDLRDSDPIAFDLLEQDSASFRRFAYGTHSEAYLQGGLRLLPVADLAQIAWTPDIGDLLTVDGIRQILGTGATLVPQWGENVIESASQWYGGLERSIYLLYGAPLP